MYQVFLTHTADKSQKKLDKPLRILIKDSLVKIGEDPEKVGEQLTMPLTNIYSYHIKYTGKEFRIAYTINNEDLSVIIHLIAAHENFYKKLKSVLNR